jgi:TPR repeat protein
MYSNGKGVPEDDAEAVKWYRKAAEQGHEFAQYNLGLMYANGRGVAADKNEARKWYRKAAEQGHAEAQYDLGVAYRFGTGVPEDYVTAYAWYSVAAASIRGPAYWRKDRDSIKQKLTPSQLEKGQVTATEISERIEKRKAAEGE